MTQTDPPPVVPTTKPKSVNSPIKTFKSVPEQSILKDMNPKFTQQIIAELHQAINCEVQKKTNPSALTPLFQQYLPILQSANVNLKNSENVTRDQLFKSNQELISIIHSTLKTFQILDI